VAYSHSITFLNGRIVITQVEAVWSDTLTGQHISAAGARTLDGGEQMARRPRTGHSRGVQAILIPDRPGGQGLNTAARPVGT